MAIFRYSAVNDSNHAISGSMEANSSKEVVTSLRERGYYITDIQGESALNKDIDLNFLKKITLKDLALFSRQFAFTLQSGMPMLRCVELCIEQTENKVLQDVLRRAKEEIKRGRALSDALKYEDGIPDFMVNMITAGEASGNLDTVMYEVSEYYDKLYKQQRKIKSATAYPKMIGVFAVLIVTFLLIFVVPQFVNNLAATGGELPLPTKIILAISNFVSAYWYIVLLIGIAAIAFKKLVLDKDGNFVLWRDKNKITGPLFGSINAQIMASRFANTFYILNNSGMSILKSLEIATNVLENSYIESKMEYAKEDIKRGNLIGKTIEDLDIFPIMLTQMITVGEETGALDALLKKTAEYYDGEAEAAVDKMISMIEPLLIIGLAGIVLVIIIAIMLPMFNMMDAVQKM